MTCDGRFFHNGEGSHSVIFDDDGRVAYCYLLNPEGRVVSDVWLYNRCCTPLEPEWKDPEKAPFANPKTYTNESDHDDFIAVDDISDVKVEWCDVGEKIIARIFIRDDFFASLTEGIKPGCSLFAFRDGPLAKMLELQ